MTGVTSDFSTARHRNKLKNKHEVMSFVTIRNDRVCSAVFSRPLVLPSETQKIPINTCLCNNEKPQMMPCLLTMNFVPGTLCRIRKVCQPAPLPGTRSSTLTTVRGLFNFVKHKAERWGWMGTETGRRPCCMLACSVSRPGKPQRVSSASSRVSACASTNDCCWVCLFGFFFLHLH